MEKRYILGTKAVHAPLNGLQEGDGAVASFCRPNKAMLNAKWVSGEVTCGVCLQRINSAHVEAEKLNEAYEAGVMVAKIWLESVGNALGESYVTYNDLFLRDERDNLSKWLHRFLGSEKTTWSNRIKSVSYYAHRLTVVEAEIARRKRACGIPACKVGCQLVHNVAEAEELAHKMNPRDVVFEIGLGQDLQLHTREVLADPMVTENNYGEAVDLSKDRAGRLLAVTRELFQKAYRTGRPTPSLEEIDAELVERDHAEALKTSQPQGPRFHFTDHPHDQIRAQRYDEICHTLLEMVATANQPTPTSKQLVKAILDLEYGEAIEENYARFPHRSFSLFGAPVYMGHRLANGVIERVQVIGSDITRTVHPQNMFMIARSHGMVQVVPEGDMVPNDSF